MKSPEQFTVEGTVLVSDKDKSGHIIRVLIETDLFERYIVNNDDQGVKLMEQLNKHVKATGVIENKQLNGDKVFTISGFEVII